MSNFLVETSAGSVSLQADYADVDHGVLKFTNKEFFPVLVAAFVTWDRFERVE